MLNGKIRIKTKAGALERLIFIQPYGNILTCKLVII